MGNFYEMTDELDYIKDLTLLENEKQMTDGKSLKDKLAPLVQFNKNEKTILGSSKKISDIPLSDSQPDGARTL